jgi:hypothetical protein
MGQISLGQYAYRRGNGLLPSIRLENVFFERVPVNLKDQVALLTRPALTSYTTVGTGPIRCVARKAGALNGDALVVSGEVLYRVAAGPTSTLVGTVPGTGVVEIAASPDVALIANGGALLQTDGVTVTAKAFPLSQYVQSVGYINGYFLAVPVESHRIYYTDLLTGSSTRRATSRPSATPTTCRRSSSPPTRCGAWGPTRPRSSCPPGSTRRNSRRSSGWRAGSTRRAC